MKALILGAGGQVGRALFATAPAGVELHLRDRAGCDIGDAAQIERSVAEVRADIIFNAAAYTAVDQAESEPEVAERLNGQAPGLIAAAARLAGSRLVHLSTDFVFDGKASRPYLPADRPAPLSVYGRSKLAGERAVGPDNLVVRTAWVYAGTGVNFLTTMMRLMHERDEIGVVADQIGTPTSATSLARALWRLAEAGAKGIHHYTDAGVASWYDFAVAIEEEGRAAGLLRRAVKVHPIAAAEFPRPAVRPSFSVLDKSSSWNMLDGPPLHWRKSLRAALMEMKAHG